VDKAIGGGKSKGGVSFLLQGFVGESKVLVFMGMKSGIGDTKCGVLCIAPYKLQVFMCG